MTDFTETRSKLKKLAMAHGAETAIGRACHNLLEQTENYAKIRGAEAAFRRGNLAIPQMVEMANRMGMDNCDISARRVTASRSLRCQVMDDPGKEDGQPHGRGCNGVGMGTWWEWELGSTHPVKLATVWGYQNRRRA
jgi:hypothetical protein